MSLAFFKTDKEAESEGVWLPLPSGEGEIKIARIGNPDYKKLRGELERPYEKIIKMGGKIPESRSEEILIESFAKTIVKGWRGVTDENGEDLAFTYENVKTALTDLEDFRNFVAEQALNMENYRVKKAESDAKN